MDYKPSTEAWVKLPVELLKRQGISKAAAVTLAAIIDKCKHQATLSAPIDATELTQRTGYSRRTLFRALDELKALALIEINRTGRASMYTLTPGCIELCPKAVKDDHPQTFPQTKRKSRNISQLGQEADEPPCPSLESIRYIGPGQVIKAGVRQGQHREEQEAGNADQDNIFLQGKNNHEKPGQGKRSPQYSGMPLPDACNAGNQRSCQHTQRADRFCDSQGPGIREGKHQGFGQHLNHADKQGHD